VTSTYDWMLPNSIPMSMGANLVLNDKKADDQLASALEALDASMSAVTGQPLLQGVSRFANTAVGSNGQPGSVAGALGQAVGGAPASFVWSGLRQAGQLTDNTARNTYDPTFLGAMKNQVASSLPVARETLPASVDTLGRDRKQFDPETGGNSVFNVLFNPAFTKKIKDDAVLNEVRRLNDTTGETDQFPRLAGTSYKKEGDSKMTKLNATQLTNLQRTMGQSTDKRFKQIMASDEYQSATDPEKVVMLGKELTAISRQSKTKALEQDIVADSNEPQSEDGFKAKLVEYAKAIGSDPVTAFNRIFTNQTIRRTDNGAIVVERMSLKDSEAVKAKGGGDNASMKLDHTIPLQLGGSNSEDNLKLVPTADWESYTEVENYLGRQLRAVTSPRLRPKRASPTSKMAASRKMPS
jgi:hypothetical protein